MTIKLLTMGSLLTGVLTISTVASAQERYPKAPDIHPDHSVTFTLKAPEAKTVILNGSWPGGTARTSIPMVKDDKGFWSVTVGPVQPDLWTYTFQVDGVKMSDEQNVHTFGYYLDASELYIPGPKSYNYEMHEVPHGTVSAVWYPAPALKLRAKRMEVYTPPGYEGGSARYPVLYLSIDDNMDWIQLTHANNILDNLIAEGKATPMIVAMVGTVPNDAAPPNLINEPLPETTGLPSRFAAQLNPHGGMQTLPPYLDGGTSLATDAVAFIDRTYRTIPDREHRAVAGISAPGAAAFYGAMTHVGTFAWVGCFSVGWPSIPGVWLSVPTPKDAAKRFPLGGPDMHQNVDIPKLAAMLPEMTAKADLHPIAIYVGLNDPLIEAQVKMEKLLDQRSVKYYKIETPGYGHEWRYWAFTLNDFAQHIF